MWDRSTWEFINTFGDWFSALGALAAVITSLYLARRGDQVVLKVSFGIRILATPGDPNTIEYVWMSITNIGRRDATIDGVLFKPLPWTKRMLFWMIPLSPLSSPMPVTIRDGQKATYCMPTEQFREGWESLAKEYFSGLSGWVRVALLRVLVTTTSGHAFKARPDRHFRVELRALATQHASEGARSA